MSILGRRKEPAKTFDVEQLEHEVEEVMHHQLRELTSAYPMSPGRAVLLEQPQVTAQDLGAITAEAVSQQHEAAAEALAKLGTELSENMTQIEKLKLEMQEAMRICLDTAERYRAAGKSHSERIKSTAALTAEIVDQCKAMQSKLAE